MEEGADSCSRSSRKRPYTKKGSLSRSFINAAEARREIVKALQLHRQSSKPAMLCSSSSRQLTESLPVPEPTWSTTAPAVLSAPVPAAMDVLQVEWFDNVSSSYSWWFGFLKSLDKKKDAAALAHESTNALVPCLDGTDADKSDSDPNPFTDEWVVFPAVEEDTKCNAFKF